MRLLIVEDEENLAKNLKKILELKGFAVDWLADGAKAHGRILLYHKDYDAIVLDLSLPGMDGATLGGTVIEGSGTTVTVGRAGITPPVMPA